MPDPKPERLVPRRQSTQRDSKPMVNPDEAKQSDLNALVAQYRKTGTVPNVLLSNPLYGDFTGPQDLQSAMESVYSAEARFNDFPASVRTLADNSPVRFLEMIENPTERAMLEEAGLQISTNPPAEHYLLDPNPSFSQASPSPEGTDSAPSGATAPTDIAE